MFLMCLFQIPGFSGIYGWVWRLQPTEHPLPFSFVKNLQVMQKQDTPPPESVLFICSGYWRNMAMQFVSTPFEMSRNLTVYLHPSW